MRVVLCNCPLKDGERIARAVVEEGLAACVNLLPVRSVYRWKGAVEVDDEVALWIKVAAEGIEPLRARLGELHPYELPEIVALAVDVDACSPAYVAWVRAGGG